LNTFFQLWVCLVCAVLPHIALAHSDEKLSFVEGRYFEIVGTDHRSVSFANTLGEYVGERCVSFLPAGSHEFPQRIFVALRPQERVEFDGAYQIQVGTRGQVSLNLRWEVSLKFETMCRAFTEAYVVRYANFNYGSGANDRVRYWAVSALASQIYLSLRPAQQGQYMNEARETELFNISSLLALDWETSRTSELSPREGYWVLYALRQRGLVHSDLANLIDRSVAGQDISGAVEAAIQPTDEDRLPISMDAWWQSQMVDYLSKEVGYYESMSASRAWLEDLANFDAYSASGHELKTLMSLWTYREDEALRTVLEARREIIALRLERVNPAYFNSAQSLGALYEITLQTDRQFEFTHAFTVYLSDWEDTKRLHEKTDELLMAPVLE
jgi:hypothetical protein